jgi:hypothetical protein
MPIAARVTRSLAAVAVGLVVAAGSAATAAHAATAPCPADNVCLYQHSNFGGLVLAVPAGTSIPNLHLLSCAGCRSSEHSGSNGTWGDQTSAWVNNTVVVYCAYQHINYGGSVLALYAGAGSNVSSNWNDQISGLKPC